MNTRLMAGGFTAAVLLASGGWVAGAVKPHGLFSHGAVLQRGIELPVWGTANDGDKVIVTHPDIAQPVAVRLCPT